MKERKIGDLKTLRAREESGTNSTHLWRHLSVGRKGVSRTNLSNPLFSRETAITLASYYYVVPLFHE